MNMKLLVLIIVGIVLDWFLAMYISKGMGAAMLFIFALLLLIEGFIALYIWRTKKR